MFYVQVIIASFPAIIWIPHESYQPRVPPAQIKAYQMSPVPNDGHDILFYQHSLTE